MIIDLTIAEITQFFGTYFKYIENHFYSNLSFKTANFHDNWQGIYYMIAFELFFNI